MYTTDENGVFNTFASEPAVYYAEYPSPEKQSRYAFQGAVASLFVTALILTSFAVS